MTPPSSKVLLILPVPTFGTGFHIVPDLGLGYLAAALRRHGHEVEIVHSVKERLDQEGLEKRVREAAPDAVGFKVFSADVRSVAESAKRIRKALPNTKIVLGGPHPSSVPERIFQDIPEADAALVGEAETSLPFLLERFSGAETGPIPGLLAPGQNRIEAPPVFIENLDTLGHPAWDLMDPRTFPPGTHGGFVRRLPVAPVMATRGCPFRCTFCDAHRIAGFRVRRRSPEHVLEELQMLSRDYGVREAHFIDDNLTVTKPYAMDLFESMIRAELDLVWASPNGIRLESVDDELASAMKRSGCYSVAVGIESASPPILKRIRKKLDLEMVREKIGVLHRHKIRVTGLFIFGFPGDTREGMLESLRFAKKAGFDKASFSLLIVLPGTEIYEELVSGGKVDPERVDSFYYRVGYVPEGMTEKELKRLQLRGFLEFYGRPGILLNLLGEIRSWTQAGILLGKLGQLFRG